MYNQFNVQQFSVLPTQCIYVFCLDLKTNSDYCPIQLQLTGFYNRDTECLLRGTNEPYTSVVCIPLQRGRWHAGDLAISHNLFLQQ
jgi:hypothetical protein